MNIFHSPSINPLLVEERLWRNEENDCKAIRAYNLPSLCPGQGGGGALALASEDESAEKKAPNAPSEKVTVGNAEATNITVENGATLANRRFFASFLPTMNRW